MEDNQIIIDVGLEGLISSLRDLKAEYDANAEAIKNLDKESETYEQDLIKLQQQQKVLKKEMSGVEGQIQNVIKAERAQEDSLVQLRAKLNNLNKQYDSMSGMQRMGKEGQELQKKIKALNDQILNLEGSTGRWQRNVGNYQSALQGLSTSFKSAGIATGGLDKAMKMLNANPIILVITAIVAVVKKLVDAFKRNEEATMGLKQAFSALNPIIDWVRKGFDKLVDLIVKGVTAAVNGLTQAIGWLLDQLQDLGNFFGADWHMGDNFHAGVEAARELQQAENDYIKHKREWMVRSAEIDRQVADLREKAADKEKYTAEQRKAYLDEAIALETQKAETEKSLAEENLRILQQEAARSANSAEMNDQLAEAERAVIEADINLSNTKRNLSKQRNAAIKEMRAEGEAAERYAQLVNTQVAKAEQAIIALMEEGKAKRLALETAQYNATKAQLQQSLDEARRKYGQQSELFQAYASQLETLEAQHAKNIQDIEKAAAVEDLKIQADEIARSLTLAEQGTIEEFNLRAAALQNKRDQELANDRLTDMQRLLIEQQYQHDLDALDQEFERKRQDAVRQVMENRIAEMRLNYQKTGEEELALLQYNIDNLFQLQGESDAEFYARRLAAQQAYNDRKKQLAEQEMAIEKAKADYISSVAGSMSDMLEAVAGDNEALVKASKVVALAEVAIKQGVAIAEAVAAAAEGDPYTYGLRVAQAIASTIAAMTQAIASINSTSFWHGGVVGMDFAGGGVFGGFNGATIGTDNMTANVRRGEMILNAEQQRRLFEIANTRSEQPNIAEQLAAAIALMPAPVLEYEEFKKFTGKVLQYDNGQLIN